MVTKTSNVDWKFLEKIPGMPWADGNITKLFNTGDSRPPASFESLVDRNDDAAVSAVIFGREGIANCLDASLAAVRGVGTLGLDFTFEEHTGSAAKGMWAALNLDTLKARLDQSGVVRDKIGLGTDDCLARKAGATFRTLKVEEWSGGGMPGALHEQGSVLARALISVGEAQEKAGAAGSYGYGKAATAQASKIRTIIVYTCFQPTSHSKVTRRLLGVTYWGHHEVGSRDFSGWALLGHDRNGQSVDALEDEAADAFAERLGIARRRAELEEELGTTFLIVDPAFDEDQLLGSLELFWWPLLLGTRNVKMEAAVTDVHGDSWEPNVDRSHELLGQYVDAFLAAEQARSTKEGLHEDRRLVRIGEAGICSLEVRAPESPIKQSLIAQMRSPLMVVNYINHAGANPPVVGVFVAHESTNQNLRRVEPPEHDKWQMQNVGGLNATPRDIAVSRLVRDEREAAVLELRAPDPPPIYGLSAFSDRFPAVDVKVAKPKPDPEKKRKQRLVRVHLVHLDQDNELIEIDRPNRVVASGGKLQAEAEVKFFLDAERAKKVNKKSLQATVTIGARIAEDGSSGGEWLPAAVKQKLRGQETPFKQVTEDGASPAKFEGTISIAHPVYFTILTGEYEPDWTVEMTFDCNPWDVVAPTAPAQTE